MRWALATLVWFSLITATSAQVTVVPPYQERGHNDTRDYDYRYRDHGHGDFYHDRDYRYDHPHTYRSHRPDRFCYYAGGVRICP